MAAPVITADDVRSAWAARFGSQSAPDTFGVRPELRDSMIHFESGGNPQARSSKGALGLMQVMPATAAQYGVSPDQLMDPNINTQTGTRYMGDLLKRYKGDELRALVAYNEGPGRVDKGELLPQSVDFATRELGRSHGTQQPQSALGRVGSAIGSGLGGTAYAAEVPGAAPAASGGAGITADDVRAALQARFGSGGAVSSAPSPQPASGMPVGSKFGLRIGPLNLSVGSGETTGAATQEQKLDQQRQRLIQLGTEMQELYDKRLKDKLKTGQISSTGQGLEYTETGPMRRLGYENDPDITDWIVKSGQFSQALNSYYASGGGGRGGVGYFGEITSPHVPHPPQGLREVLGIWSPTGQQWDLQKQGEQLPILMHNLKRDQGLEGEQHYQQWTPDEQSLIDKYR